MLPRTILSPTHQPSPKKSAVYTVQIRCTINVRQYLQYTATSYSSLQVFYLGTRFVHIKGSDDNHLWWRCEVPADMPDGCVCHMVHTVVMTQWRMLTVVYAPVTDMACLQHSRSDAMQICKLCLLNCQLCKCVPLMRLAAVQMPCCSADLTGTGIFLTMYSQTASTLYFSCAEIGTIGAPSAIVPWIND